MKTETKPLSYEGKRAHYWARMALSVREGLMMHKVSGQIPRARKTQERPWENITEHCLVQVARGETLGRWIGLPEDLITEIKNADVLHDFHKAPEILAMREATAVGRSPLAAVKLEQETDERLLRSFGFSSRVIRLAGSTGGHAAQLIETQRILDQETLSDDDWAYLIVHYVDDCSIGSDWVLPSKVDASGRRVNIIDYRAEENKTIYHQISQEIRQELASHPKLGGMDTHDAMSIVSHEIEKRLAERIFEKTEERIDPLLIPEVVDQKIRNTIKQS